MRPSGEAMDFSSVGESAATALAEAEMFSHEDQVPGGVPARQGPAAADLVHVVTSRWFPEIRYGIAIARDRWPEASQGYPRRVS